MRRPLTPVLTGLGFTEGPRWHHGRLWFSDFSHRVVRAYDPESDQLEVVVEIPGQPSGLGWRPDGTLLIVSMLDRRLLAFDGSRLTEVADLSGIAPERCNDMVVDAHGRAYIGNFGFDMDDPDADQATTVLILVEPDGTSRVVADELFFPNGTVITGDGRTLVVGESFGAVLTAFDVEPDGSLTNRRTWARLSGAIPDGICLDVDGAIWVASPISHNVLRVAEGGAILDEVRTADEVQPFACMLGGADRRTLFVCCAPATDAEEVGRTGGGRIEQTAVDVPGAGLP